MLDREPAGAHQVQGNFLKKGSIEGQQLSLKERVIHVGKVVLDKGLELAVDIVAVTSGSDLWDGCTYASRRTRKRKS